MPPCPCASVALRLRAFAPPCLCAFVPSSQHRQRQHRDDDRQADDQHCVGRIRVGAAPHVAVVVVGRVSPVAAGRQHDLRQRQRLPALRTQMLRAGLADANPLTVAAARAARRHPRRGRQRPPAVMTPHHPTRLQAGQRLTTPAAQNHRGGRRWPRSQRRWRNDGFHQRSRQSVSGRRSGRRPRLSRRSGGRRSIVAH